MPEAVGMEVGKEPKSNQADALQDIIFLHHPTQFETVRYHRLKMKKPHRHTKGSVVGTKVGSMFGWGWSQT